MFNCIYFSVFWLLPWVTSNSQTLACQRLDSWRVSFIIAAIDCVWWWVEVWECKLEISHEQSSKEIRTNVPFSVAVLLDLHGGNWLPIDLLFIKRKPSMVNWFLLVLKKDLLVSPEGITRTALRVNFSSLFLGIFYLVRSLLDLWNKVRLRMWKSNPLVLRRSCLIARFSSVVIHLQLIIPYFYP